LPSAAPLRSARRARRPPWPAAPRRSWPARRQAAPASPAERKRKFTDNSQRQQGVVYESGGSKNLQRRRQLVLHPRKISERVCRVPCGRAARGGAARAARATRRPAAVPSACGAPPRAWRCPFFFALHGGELVLQPLYFGLLRRAPREHLLMLPTHFGLGARRCRRRVLQPPPRFRGGRGAAARTNTIWGIEQKHALTELKCMTPAARNK